MANHICVTCGTQFAESDAPPTSCPICADERQYVGHGGQRWTTLAALRAAHRNEWGYEGAGLLGVGTTPRFAIGQRALLVRAEGGNVLWDCVALLDDATVDIVRALGGVRAIAVSHPHYYTTVVEWSRALGDVPVYLHAADREHVMRPDAAIRFWDDDALALGGGLTLVRAGGHFAGGTVLHWAGGAHGRGALLAGDIIQVVPDRRWVSFMYSYPNLIPLPAAEVRRIAAAVAPYAFEQLYGAWWGLNVLEDAAGAVRRSAARYEAALAAVPGTAPVGSSAEWAVWTPEGETSVPAPGGARP
jgi:hypothetical protein